MSNTPPEQPADGRRSQVYLLRLWCDAAGAPWRLSLRTSGDGTTIGLADLDELVVFLLHQMTDARTDMLGRSVPETGS